MEKSFNNKNKGKFNKSARDNRREPVSDEMRELMISGRNAVRELLMGERDIDKIYVSIYNTYKSI